MVNGGDDGGGKAQHVDDDDDVSPFRGGTRSSLPPLDFDFIRRLVKKHIRSPFPFGLPTLFSKLQPWAGRTLENERRFHRFMPGFGTKDETFAVSMNEVLGVLEAGHFSVMNPGFSHYTWVDMIWEWFMAAQS
jgi:hypothetical protein